MLTYCTWLQSRLKVSLELYMGHICLGERRRRVKVLTCFQMSQWPRSHVHPSRKPVRRNSPLVTYQQFHMTMRTYRTVRSFHFAKGLRTYLKTTLFLTTHHEFTLVLKLAPKSITFNSIHRTLSYLHFFFKRKLSRGGQLSSSSFLNQTTCKQRHCGSQDSIRDLYNETIIKYIRTLF